MTVDDIRDALRRDARYEEETTSEFIARLIRHKPFIEQYIKELRQAESDGDIGMYGSNGFYVLALLERIAELEADLGWMRAAHTLLANDEAFIGQPDGSVFFMEAGVKEGVPTLALNMNDTFEYACADCEPFSYSDAPMLLEISKSEGWPGLVRWASEQRKKRGEPHEPIAPVKRAMDKEA